MPATSVSAVENYIRAEKPSSFSGTAREILLAQGKRKRKREREGGGGGGSERRKRRSKMKEDKGKNRMVE